MKILNAYLFLYCLCFFAHCNHCLAKDFGTQGYTFAIQEKSLVEAMQENAQNTSQENFEEQANKLAEKIRSGQSLFKKVPWIEEATQDNSFLYDPSITLEEDILDAEGKTLFLKGTKIDPLQNITLDSGLLFFDGDNPKHVAWAEKQTGEFKWILTSGNPLKLQEQKNRTVFFDQGAIYSKKFSIKKIPCRITQKGSHLLIEEIALKKSKLNFSRSESPNFSQGEDQPTPFHSLFGDHGIEKCPSGDCTQEDPQEESFEEEPPLNVLISFSMPENCLIALSKELERYGGTFVLRGFPKNSLYHFIHETSRLKKKGVKTPFTIDPDLFERCTVVQVPSIVLKENKALDKVTGNIPVREALELFAQTGDTKRLAKQIKNREPQWSR